MHWYLDVLKNYTGFSGRARRTEYWMFILFSIIVIIALSVVDGIVGLNGILILVYYLATFLPSVAVTIRRLHDTDRSGWWLLVSLVPLFGGIILLILCCLEGTSGQNQYGPDSIGSEG